MEQHLPGEVAISCLSLFLLITSLKKAHQVLQLKQQNWQQSNPAAQTQSRRTLQRFLNPDAWQRLPDSVQWSRREAAKELIPQILGALFTAGFFAIKPRDISSSSVPDTMTSPLRFFYIASIFGIVLHSLFENIDFWMLVEHAFGTQTIRKYKAVHDFFLSVLGGSTRDASTRNVLLVVDSAWMYMIPSCTFPLFCSYETTPPRLLGTEITCWDNHFHWMLVGLSAYGLTGVFVWSLSMVLRKSNWPADVCLHRLQGIYENFNNPEQGLRLEVHHKRDGNLAVELKLRDAKPTGRAWALCLWHYEPWRSHGLKGTLQPDSSSSSFQALLEFEELPELQPAAADSDGFWDREVQCALLPPLEAELELKVEDGTDDGSCRGLCISSKTELRDPRLQEVTDCVGQWRQVAFLTTPHAVEPLPTFVLTILKVCGTLAWSTYVPPHAKEAWRVGIVAFMVCISLAIAAVSHFYRPSVFACVNTLNVVVMFLAAAVSVGSLVHASLVTPGSLSTIVVSWILEVASVVSVASCLAAVAWTFSDDELWGSAAIHLRGLSQWANELMPFWDVYLGDSGLVVGLSVRKWRDYYRTMCENYGIDDASQVFSPEHGTVRIIEVLVQDRAQVPDSREGITAIEPSPEGQPLLVAGNASKWVLYEEWKQQQCGQEVLAQVLGAIGDDDDEQVVEGSHQGCVRVVSEFRSWVSLVAMGKYRPHPKSRRNNKNLEGLNLSTNTGQPLQAVPGHSSAHQESRSL